MKFNKIANKRSARPDALNLAGGEAYQQSNKLELVTILLTSFLDEKYYRSANQTVQRIRELIAGIADKQFIAKAALYARQQAGMRSVSHLVAGELARQVKGEKWTKAFFDQVACRVDDVLEILSYSLHVYGKPVPNSLKKGLGRALARFDAYQLAKYRKDAAELKLVDAVNLLHPPHTEALAQLVNGTLAPADTWETRLSQAGQQAENEEEKDDLKAEAWAGLITQPKIGYFALLRNLRNIVQQAPALIDDAISLLVDERLIRGSKVLPFRFRTALDSIESAGLPREASQKIVAALSRAVDLSLRNVPRFAGSTLVALDCSGSMSGKPIQIGSLFASVLYKANEADIMLFSDDARFVAPNENDAVLSIAKYLEAKAQCGGTNFHAIFDGANQAYQRIIILSDMQAWVGHHCPAKSLANYVKRSGHRPKIYSFDLAGYGTLQFPEKEIYTLAGFSDKTMDILRFLEEDKSALIREIEKIQL